MTTAIQPACPDTYSELKDFHAFHNTMPPGPHSLYVIGTVVVSSLGYTVQLTEAASPGVNPTILLLELLVRKPASEAAAQIQEHQVRWDHPGPYAGGYAEVHILCGSNIVQKLAIKVVT